MNQTPLNTRLLETHPETEAHQPWRTGRAVNLAKRRAGQAGAGVVEIRVIQRVKEVRCEAEVHRLAGHGGGGDGLRGL